jgi:hypothetical protein
MSLRHFLIFMVLYAACLAAMMAGFLVFLRA